MLRVCSLRRSIFGRKRREGNHQGAQTEADGSLLVTKKKLKEKILDDAKPIKRLSNMSLNGDVEVQRIDINFENILYTVSVPKQKGERKVN
jgi:hypothetical protein